MLSVPVYQLSREMDESHARMRIARKLWHDDVSWESRDADCFCFFFQPDKKGINHVVSLGCFFPSDQ